MLRIITLVCATSLPSIASADWSGLYIGTGLGSSSNLGYEVVPQVSPNVEFEDGSSFEIFGGTRTMASENIVLGAEASALFVDGSNVSGTVYLDYIIDTKLSVGIAVDNLLVYGVFGFSTANGQYDTSIVTAPGIGGGLGVAYKFGDDFSINGEYYTRSMLQEFEDADLNVTANSLSVRGAIHF